MVHFCEKNIPVHTCFPMFAKRKNKPIPSPAIRFCIKIVFTFDLKFLELY